MSQKEHSRQGAKDKDPARKGFGEAKRKLLLLGPGEQRQESEQDKSSRALWVLLSSPGFICDVQGSPGSLGRRVTRSN